MSDGVDHGFGQLKADLDERMYATIDELEADERVAPEVAMDLRRCVRDRRLDDLQTMLRLLSLQEQHDPPDAGGRE